jgi:hypothetical protein
MDFMIRTSPATARLAALLLGVVFALGAVAPAALAEGAADDGSVTWSVSPANADGADGRVRIEATLDPGESIVEHLTVKNLSAVAVTFAIKAADGYRTSTGRFNMLPSDQESVDAGTWIEAPETVLVGPNESVVVEFTITVPETVTPGDHAAGIAATIESIGTGADGNQLNVESRVGFPVLLRVSGELSPSLAVEPVSVSYNFSWNPFEPGEVVATYNVINDGNVRMEATPVVASQGQTNEQDADAQPLGLLPGDRRQVTTTVPGVWPLFFAPVQVQIAPMAVVPDGDPQAAGELVLDMGVWAIPVPQLLVLLGTALVLSAILVGRRRSKLQLAAKLEAAREAGRREVGQG